MKILNYILEANFRSLRPVTHFKIHKHEYYSHLVWGPLSLVWGQPHLTPVQVHTGCGGEVQNVGEDGISYCTECEHICEGDTEYITTEEWEMAQ